jgi:hypothetical protein
MTSPAGQRGFQDLICVIHVHSTFSDGTATVPEIAGAASAAGADAVLLTDHDTRGAAPAGLEGWHGEVLVLAGHEVSTRGGHLLAFDTEEEIEHHGLTEEEICQELGRRGGFGFAAHPFSQGGFSKAIVRPHPWSALEHCPDLGIELWSVVTEAAESWRSPLAALRYLRDPESALEGPPAENLARWDELCQKRRVPAIGGLDAHQTGVRIRNRALSPMPHERYFRLLRTHLLLDSPPSRDLSHDRELVYAALREGRCYLAADAIAPGTGFSFTATLDNGDLIPMGAQSLFAPGTLRVSAPREARLRVLRDGAMVAEGHGTALEHSIEVTGAYRAEAWLHWRGRERLWLVSNPIYLRPPGSPAPEAAPHPPERAPR